MGQATTAKAIHMAQLHAEFPALPLAVQANDLTSTTEEKVVVVDGRTDQQVAAVLAAYIYDPDFDKTPEQEDSEVADAYLAAARSEWRQIVTTPGATFANASLRDRTLAAIALKLFGR